MKKPASGPPASDIKNVRITPFSTGDWYRAFGPVCRTDPDKCMMWYRKGKKHQEWADIAHSGGIFRCPYTISTDTWGTEVMQLEDATNMEDVWGGVMDNGQTVLFNSITDFTNPDPPYYTDSVYFVKLDSSFNQIGGRHELIYGVGGVEQLDRGWVFGGLQAGDSPGEYFIAMIQLNNNDSPRVKVNCLKTTDYFATWSTTIVYDSSLSTPGDNTSFTGISEVTIAYLGSNKMVASIRVDQGGDPILRFSADKGATWHYPTGTSDPQIILGWFGYQVRVVYYFMWKGKLTIFFQDRDAGFMSLSKNNDPVTFAETKNYNLPEVYHHNDIASGFFGGLGYGSMCHIGVDSDDERFLLVWSRSDLEGVGGSKATVWYSRDDLITDPVQANPVAPPVLTPTTSSTTEARVEITGYTLDETDNIRYWEFDLSTNSGFSSFVTASYRPASLLIDTLFQNRRQHALFVSFNRLVSGTTYYYRVRAYNNYGHSAYTQTNFTMP